MTRPAPEFPFIALLVSGGHSQLMRIDGVGRYSILGETLDDAAGEAFDKTAQLLELGYPGGPALAALAREGTPGRVKLPRPMLTSGDLNFSFSGLKTAVSRHVAAERAALGIGSTDALPPATTANICASFQRVVVATLLDRLFDAARWYQVTSVGIAGGVSANSRLRDDARARGAAAGIRVVIPPVALSTDNAAMIAAAGLRRLEHYGAHDAWDVNAEANLAL